MGSKWYSISSGNMQMESYMGSLPTYFTETGDNQHWSREFAQNFLWLKGEQAGIFFSLAY